MHKKLLIYHSIAFVASGILWFVRFISLFFTQAKSKALQVFASISYQIFEAKSIVQLQIFI